MINYKVGDATTPYIGAILQVVNNIGAYGAGFSGAIANKYPIVESQYHSWSVGIMSNHPFGLGEIQSIEVKPKLFVVNIVGQNGVRSSRNPTPIDYDALREGLVRVSELFDSKTLIHAPRIGAGLAGGDWNQIETIINETLSEFNVTIYDLGASK